MEYKEIVENLDMTIGISYMLGFPWQVEFYKSVKKEIGGKQQCIKFYH